MPSHRYRKFNLHVQRRDGTGADGAQIRVTKSDGSAPSLWSGDSLTGTENTSGIVIAGNNGFATFFAGDRDEIYHFAVPEGQIIQVYETTRTVYDHVLTGDHADGTIGLSQLSEEVQDLLGSGGDDGDVAVHAALQANTHGLAGTEHFVHTKAGSAAGATDSPDLADVTVDSLTVADEGTLLGYKVVNNAAELEAAVTGASDGDVIILAAGTYTLTSTLTISDSISLIGWRTPNIAAGNQVYITQATDFGTLIELDSSNVKLEGLNIQGISVASAAVRALQGVVRISNCGILNLAGGHALRFEPGGSANYAYLTDVGCITGTGQAIRIVDWAAPLYAINCSFAAATASNNAAHLSGSNAECNFTNCTFATLNADDACDVASANARFVGCTFFTVGGAALRVQALGTGCYAPETQNVFTGTVVDASLNIVRDWNKWDWVSGIVDVDNTASALTDEYFVVGSAGIGGTFAHNLGTRNVEVLVQVGSNSSMTGETWTLNGSQLSLWGGNPAAGSSLVPAAGHMSVHITDANNVRLVMYAGEAQTGAAAYTATGDYIWTAVDADAIVGATTSAAYDFTAAGGVALKQVWVRVFVRRLRLT